MLITIAVSLDPNQARQNVWPDLDPNCLTLMVFPKEFFKKVDFEKNLQVTRRHAKLPSMQRVNTIFIWAGSILDFWASLATWYTKQQKKRMFNYMCVFSHLLKNPMPNIWLNMKTTALWRKSKIRECRATAYVLLRLWYKYELRKYSHQVIYKHVPVEFWYTYFTQKLNLTKWENFLTLNVYCKHRNA